MIKDLIKIMFYDPDKNDWIESELEEKTSPVKRNEIREEIEKIASSNNV